MPERQRPALHRLDPLTRARVVLYWHGLLWRQFWSGVDYRRKLTLVMSLAFPAALLCAPPANRVPLMFAPLLVGGVFSFSVTLSSLLPGKRPRVDAHWLKAARRALVVPGGVVR